MTDVTTSLLQMGELEAWGHELTGPRSLAAGLMVEPH